MRKNSIKIALLVLFGITTMAMNGQIKITGTVVDEDDKPVEFAAVRIEGTMLGVNTDLNGRYEITVPEKDTINVVFSCIGYSDYRICDLLHINFFFYNNVVEGCLSIIASNAAMKTS